MKQENERMKDDEKHNEKERRTGQIQIKRPGG
jgi:hypothetical protein